jgi:hypothetical protein
MEQRPWEDVSVSARQLVKELSGFYGKQKFITVLTWAATERYL